MRRLAIIGVTLAGLWGVVAAVEAAGHIEAATQFLLGWGKGSWDDVAGVAAEKVTVSVGGKTAAIDVAGKQSEATLVFPFKGLSTVRTGGAVTGITVDEITVKLGGEAKTGKGMLKVGDKNGKPIITELSVE